MSLLRHGAGGSLEPHLPKDFKELGELAHLLFEWPVRQAPRLALPGCILIAAILQAAMIFLFSISYTTPLPSQPVSPQIYFIPPDSAAARQLAPWLAANDPAVFSPQYDTQDAIPSPPPLKYRPSYEEPPPPLRPLPEETHGSLAPPLFPQMTDMVKNKPVRLTSSKANLPLSVPATLVKWQDDLATRLRQTSSQETPFALTPMAQPALYQVGVSEEGVPMHCVQLESSGDPATDEAGSVWIHAQRFQPAEQVGWGRVIMLWGVPAASSTPSPAAAKP